MHSSLLAKVRHQAAAVGFNLFGLVDAVRHDACQPKERRTTTVAPRCGTVLVIGTGGRSFWEHFSGSSNGRATPETDRAVWQFAHEGALSVKALLRSQSVSSCLIGMGRQTQVSLARLAEAAGLGTVSPVSGLLLHPQYGPWVAVRAALLIDGQPFGPVPDASITDRFQPCCGCNQPCVSACPANVHDGLGNQDLARCAAHRHEGNCAVGCTSRSACPVGSEHRDAPGERAHRHAHSMSAMQRGFGLGVWRFLPRFFRRSL